MRRTDPEGHDAVGHGPVRYGPHLPDDGLPVLPELSAVLAAAADRARGEPVGGAPASRPPRAATGTGAACPPIPARWPPPPVRTPCCLR